METCRPTTNEELNPVDNHRVSLGPAPVEPKMKPQP